MDKNQSVADNYIYSNYDIVVRLEKENLEKYQKFVDKVKAFESVCTIEQAKDLAEKILPEVLKANSFSVGNAKCTVVNTDKLFRLCIDSSNEFISYDFM